MMVTEELQSKVIAFLRFPLSMGVVLIHSNLDVVMGGARQMEAGDYPIYTAIHYLFSEIFSRTAVPLFFFFSGFLFFYKTNGFPFSAYGQKLKKRARTLLTPYIIWNLIVIGFYFCAQTLMPGLLSGDVKLVRGWNLSDWFRAFWDIRRGEAPINPPLWFVRDLMVAMLCSPLIYILAKKAKQYGVMLLGLLWMMHGSSRGVIPAFFFFTAGAYFGIQGKDFAKLLKPHLKWFACAYALIAIIELLMRDKAGADYVHNIGILAGMCFFVSLCAHFIERGTWKTSAFLAGSSFFMFAYHDMPLRFVIKALCKLVQPQSDIALMALYVACPAITVSVGLCLYWLLKRYLPGFTSVITGGR